MESLQGIRRTAKILLSPGPTPLTSDEIGNGFRVTARQFFHLRSSLRQGETLPDQMLAKRFRILVETVLELREGRGRKTEYDAKNGKKPPKRCNPATTWMTHAYLLPHDGTNCGFRTGECQAGRAAAPPASDSASSHKGRPCGRREGGPAAHPGPTEPAEP